MQMPELDTLVYSSLPDKPLYLALLLSIFIHGLLIVPGFLWILNTQPASYQSPLIFEVSLLGTSEYPIRDDMENANKETVLPNSHQKTETTVSEQEYIKSLPPQTVLEQVALEAEPNSSTHRESPSDLGESQTEEYKIPISQSVVTNIPAPVLVGGVALNDEQFGLISSRLDLLLDQIKREDSSDQWEFSGQKYTFNVEHIASKNNTSMDKVRVEISTVIDGVEMFTVVQMKRLAFSSFVQIINRWDPEIAFSQDVIEGRFHSNSRIHIAKGKKQEPTFKGKVSVSSGVSIYSQSAKKRIFQGGIETGVKKIQFPQNMLGGLPDDSSLILRMNQDSNVTFLANGDYSWFLLDEPDNIFLQPASESTRYILGGEGIKISVKGVVKGTVVIHAEDKISVTGDLIYADSPEDFPGSTDYLGLISERYVEVASPKITGRGDITIHAAILAKRRFVIKSPRTRSHALLTILGSLTAGSMSVSEPRFSTLLKFDDRFEDKRLPGFPVTDKYELESWDAKWTPRLPATL